MPTFQKTERSDEMLEVEEAQRRTLAEVRSFPPEDVALEDALKRILREDIVAPQDVPSNDNSAMDGYAVRAVDVGRALTESPVVLSVIEDLAAGTVALKFVGEGMATRIMTGALMPEGADAVVPVELTDAGSSTVHVYSPVRSGENIRRRGEDMRAGQQILHDGVALGAAEIGVLATARRQRVVVGERPTVAIISTGDEIINIDQPMQAGKVVNSNSWSLASMVREVGAIPRMFGIVEDSLEATMRAIASARAFPFIISSGGVSVGAFDFVKDALDALGAETIFRQIAMKPGKPVVLARLGESLYFGLPGNPVSCMVAFILFIAPSLRKAMGQRSNLLSPTVSIRMREDIRSRGDRRSYQRVRVRAGTDGILEGMPMKAQGSGVSTSMVGANGLAVLEKGTTLVESGSVVSAVLFGPVLSE